MARDEFFAAWRAASGELAISLHHLQEIGQLGDSASLTARLAVLKLFPVVRCRPASSVDVQKMEILTQLQNFQPLPPGSLPDSKTDYLFPHADPASLAENVTAFRIVFQMFRTGLQQGTSAEALAKTAREDAGKGIRLRKDIDWDRVREEFPKRFDAILDSFGPLADFMRGSADEIINTFAAGRDSVKKSVVKHLGLDQVEESSDLHEHELPWASVFFQEAAEVAADLDSKVGGNPTSWASLVRKLHPHSAPGFSLKLAAHVGRANHSKKPEPGDQIDEDHLTFAPYVDLLLVDKRTLDYVQRGLRTRGRTGDAASGKLRKVSNLADLTRLVAGSM